MKILIAMLALTLYGCAATVAKPPPPKTVVVLGNKTAPSVCECPDAAAERARADRWKAYAEKLERQFRAPSVNEDQQ